MADGDRQRDVTVGHVGLDGLGHRSPEAFDGDDIETGGDQHERALAAARLAGGINQRTAGTHRALREAATADPSAAQRLRDLEESRRTTIAQALALVAGRPVTDEERDTVWAVGSVEVHQLLTGISDWSEEHYQTWLADAVVRALAEHQEGEEA